MKRSIYTLVFFIVMIFGCEKEEISKSAPLKLDYYIESYELPGLGFIPQLKVAYQYESGKLSKYTVFSYDPDLQSLVEQRHFDFSYVNDQVDKIKGYLTGVDNHYIEYSYQYLPDSRVLKITENNLGAGINSEANFSYDDPNESVEVVYSFSTGGSFKYKFFYQSENILSDMTTQGAQLCNAGAYTYDHQNNPFKDLGYVDYQLNYLSANNKLTEEVSYVGCSFPSLVPEYYTYEYNDQGYPTVATTFFSSGAKSEKKFFYQ